MDAIVKGLAEKGWAVAPAFLPVDLVTALAQEAEGHCEAGRLAEAGTGKGKDRAIRPAIRNDSIYWIDTLAATSAVQHYLQHMEALRLDLNCALQLGLFDLEAHFARYPKGAFYAKHLDVFRSDEKRTLSVICYLNQGWQPEQGGQLRLYPASGEIIDVLPNGGTLACFISSGMQHEVLPATRTRLSLTGWFRRR